MMSEQIRSVNVMNSKWNHENDQLCGLTKDDLSTLQTESKISSENDVLYYLSVGNSDQPNFEIDKRMLKKLELKSEFPVCRHRLSLRFSETIFGKSIYTLSVMFNRTVQSLKENFTDNWLGFSKFNRNFIDQFHIPNYCRELFPNGMWTLQGRQCRCSWVPLVLIDNCSAI